MNETVYQEIYGMLLSAMGEAVAEGALPAKPLPAFHLHPTAEESVYETDLPALVGETIGKTPEELLKILEAYWWLSDAAVARYELQDGLLRFWREL